MFCRGSHICILLKGCSGNLFLKGGLTTAGVRPGFQMVNRLYNIAPAPTFSDQKVL